MNIKGFSFTALGIIFILFGLLLAVYPFIPSLLYSLTGPSDDYIQVAYTEDDLLGLNEPLTPGQLPEISDNVTVPADSGQPLSRIVIPKIGVDMELFDGQTSATLEKGAWRLPQSANPAQIGNTIITAHRYKYRPPSSKTFYLLDKMAIGDTFTVYWNGGEYNYLIDKIEIKSGNDLSILEDSFDRRVSFVTCDPLFSTKNRLIVSGRLLRI